MQERDARERYKGTHRLRRGGPRVVVVLAVEAGAAPRFRAGRPLPFPNSTPTRQQPGLWRGNNPPRRPRTRRYR